MKKVVKLSESELSDLVTKIVSETELKEGGIGELLKTLFKTAEKTGAKSVAKDIKLLNNTAKNFIKQVPEKVLVSSNFFNLFSKHAPSLKQVKTSINEVDNIVRSLNYNSPYLNRLTNTLDDITFNLPTAAKQEIKLSWLAQNTKEAISLMELQLKELSPKPSYFRPNDSREAIIAYDALKKIIEKYIDSLRNFDQDLTSYIQSKITKTIKENHKKTIRLTESELTNLIKRVISEDIEMLDVSSDSDFYKARKREVSIPKDDLSLFAHFATRYCESKENLPDCQRVRKLYSQYQLFM